MHGGSPKAEAIRSVQMKQKKKILWMLLPVLVFGGCGSQGSVLKRTQEESSLLETQEKEPETADGAETKDGQEENPEQTEESLPEWIYVDVCGAVENPGVYRIEAGSRVFQVLEQAGGCTEDASLETVNQADLLSDGQKIRIYTKEEAGQMEKKLQEEDPLLDDRVDINRAGKEELMTLTGVGETRAQAILAYRETHGSFSSVEELMQVEGIKEKTYEKLKDQIRIN